MRELPAELYERVPALQRSAVSAPEGPGHRTPGPAARLDAATPIVQPPDAHASGNNSSNSERGECTVTPENTRP